MTHRAVARVFREVSGTKASRIPCAIQVSFPRGRSQCRFPPCPPTVDNFRFRCSGSDGFGGSLTSVKRHHDHHPPKFFVTCSTSGMAIGHGPQEPAGPNALPGAHCHIVHLLGGLPLAVILNRLRARFLLVLSPPGIRFF